MMIEKSTKRIEYIDTLRGLATLYVMMVHSGYYISFFSVFVVEEIAIFFFVSGLVLKCENVKKFLYNRVLKLLVCYIVIAYFDAIVNVSAIKSIIAKPSVIFTIIGQCTRNVIVGEAVWFVPTLIVLTVFAYAIIHAFEYLKMDIVWSLFFSTLISVVTFYFAITSGSHLPWYIDTAAINQVFMVLGYVAIKKGWINILSNSKFFLPIMLVLYIPLLILNYNGMGYPGSNKRMNAYPNIFVYIAMSVFFILLFMAVSMRFKRIPLVTFMGRHSLIYFVFGGHAYTIPEHILDHLGVNLNEVVRMLICSFSACLIWIPFCIIIDKVFPILNGQIKLPQLRERNL